MDLIAYEQAIQECKVIIGKTALAYWELGEKISNDPRLTNISQQKIADDIGISRQGLSQAILFYERIHTKELIANAVSKGLSWHRAAKLIPLLKDKTEQEALEILTEPSPEIIRHTKSTTKKRPTYTPPPLAQISEEFKEAFEALKWQIIKAKKDKWVDTSKEAALQHIKALENIINI